MLTRHSGTDLLPSLVIVLQRYDATQYNWGQMAVNAYFAYK